MLSFLQLNGYLLASLFFLFVIWFVGVIKAPKELFKVITVVFGVVALGIVFAMTQRVVYNQVPKREVPRQYVDNGVQKFQERVLNNAGK